VADLAAASMAVAAVASTAAVEADLTAVAVTANQRFSKR
jgi:hypothetical protein